MEFDPGLLCDPALLWSATRLGERASAEEVGAIASRREAALVAARRVLRRCESTFAAMMAVEGEIPDGFLEARDALFAAREEYGQAEQRAMIARRHLHRLEGES